MVLSQLASMIERVRELFKKQTDKLRTVVNGIQGVPTLRRIRKHYRTFIRKQPRTILRRPSADVELGLQLENGRRTKSDDQKLKELLASLALQNWHTVVLETALDVSHHLAACAATEYNGLDLTKCKLAKSLSAVQRQSIENQWRY